MPDEELYYDITDHDLVDLIEKNIEKLQAVEEVLRSRIGINATRNVREGLGHVHIQLGLLKGKL